MPLTDDLVQLLQLTGVLAPAVGAFDRAIGQRLAAVLAREMVLSSPAWAASRSAAGRDVGERVVEGALTCGSDALPDVLLAMEAVGRRGLTPDPLLAERVVLARHALDAWAATSRWILGTVGGAGLGAAVAALYAGEGAPSTAMWVAAGALAMPGAESLRTAFGELIKILPRSSPISILPVSQPAPPVIAEAPEPCDRDELELLAQYERNWTGRTILPRATGVRAARTRNDVLTGLNEAAARRASVRVIAGTFSDTSALGTSGLQLQVGGLTLPNRDWVRDLDPGRLETAQPGRRLLEVAAGARVNDVNEALAKRSWALEMVGAFSGQTFIGALSTGTHGSGHQPLAAFVRSIEIICIGADGRPKSRRIERATDPVLSAAATQSEGSTLERNDRVFEAVVISSGGAGVITSVVIEAVAEFRLVETRESTTWGAVAGSLPASILDTTVHARSLLLNPYDGASSTGIACVISTLVRNGAEDGAVGKTGGAPAHADGAGQAIDAAMARKEDIGRNLRVHAMDMPPVGQPKKYVNDSWRLLTSPNRLPPGVSIEYAFAPAQAAAAVTAMLDHLIARFPDDVCVVGPISIRGIRRFDTPLSPSDQEDRIAVEVLAALGSSTVALHHGDLALEELTAIALRFGGRVHWGQLRPPDLSMATRQFPRYADWRGICVQLDPLELFRNDFPR
jgi:hypothetical protein